MITGVCGRMESHMINIYQTWVKNTPKPPGTITIFAVFGAAGY